jgi:hypothetical protein
VPSTLDVMRLIQHFTGCSQAEAHPAAVAVCRDPEALDLLLKAAAKCGAATAGVGAGGAILVAGLSPVSAPMIGIGAGVAGLSAKKAKQFCSEMIDRGPGVIPESIRDLLR